MDGNNHIPAQGESSLGTNDWRAKFPNASRLRILNTIVETLKKTLSAPSPENLAEIRSFAMTLDERIYSIAANESDYLRRISQKMVAIESKSQPNVGTISLLSNSAGRNQCPSDPALHGMQSHSANHSQPQQQHLVQNLQNTVTSPAVETSANLPPAQPSVTTPSQSAMSNAIGQSLNLQNVAGITQNAVCNLAEQGLQSNMFANSQKQMQGRQHLQQVIPQQHKHQLIMNHQMKQLLLMQRGNIQPLQSHMQQQQRLQQPNQMQPSQQTLMQMSSRLQSSQPNFQQTQYPNMKSAPESRLQQNQQPSVQQSASSVPHPQSALRQQRQSQQLPLHEHASDLHQQQSPISQQSMLTSQQQLQLMGQQSSATDIQKNQLLGQQDSVPEMQYQHQRLLGQQSNLSNMEQPQQLLQGQQNISNFHHHQQLLGLQSSVSGLQKQQQQLLGSQLSVSNMQQQNSLQMVQEAKIASHQQQTQQTPSPLFPSQTQHSQSRPTQQHLRSQLHQQPNLLQQEMQHSIQTSGALLQPQNAIDQQKQLLQSQRGLPETSSTSIDSTTQIGHSGGVDWQEEVYQKISSMKELYLPEMCEVYRIVTLKLQQHDALIQSPKQQSDQCEKLRTCKSMIEKMISFLQLHKSNIVPRHKEIIPALEKQILQYIRTSRSNKLATSQLQGQFQQFDDHSSPSPQLPESQFLQLQKHDSNVKQMQTTNLQVSVTSVPAAAMTSMHHGSMPLSTHLESAPGNVLSSFQKGAISSFHQSTMGSLQHNIVHSALKTSANTFSQSNLNAWQSNLNPLQPNSNIPQNQHQKQQLEQQLKLQYQQHHSHQQMLQQQKKKLLQQQQSQLQQHQKLHQSPQLQTFQMPQLHQLNEVNELKMTQSTGVKMGLFQQHHPAGQRPTYPQQQLKMGPCLVSSPQLLATSPQISQHSSPQIDQQSLPASLSKGGMPSQSANSPFTAPSPSTPFAPSPMTGDPEKQSSDISSLSNARNIGPQQTALGLTQAQSPAIGTPWISGSPLLAEFTSLDGNQSNTSSILSGKSSATEQPLERLIKVMRSISSKAFNSSISEISSVVSMVDRIAGSTPGNGCRSAVGEDLVAMTKCRFQARSSMSHDSSAATNNIKRNTSAILSNVVWSAGSVDDSLKQVIGVEISELESTATSRVKRRRVEANHCLLEEIRLINQRLIDTVVELSDEDVDSIVVAADGEGTVVKCSFSAVALSPNLKFRYDLGQMPPILPLWFLVPVNYPNCSPVLLDKSSVELRKEHEDLSVKARSMFGISIRGLPQPMSLGETVRTWDICARKIVTEYAQQSGGGSFSSRYGTWESCLNA